MTKLKALGTPIAKLAAKHNNNHARKRDSNEANGLLAELFLAVGAWVMLTSNLWTDVGLHNGAKGIVVDLVYKTPAGPTFGDLPEAVVVQFCDLDAEIDQYLDGVPRTVAIPLITAEWKSPSGNGGVFTREQIPLALSWAFTIHKAQGKTLDLAVIDLGKSEKCSGMTLVALSRVRGLKDLLLKPFSMERLDKVNKANSLPLIKAALVKIHAKALRTKDAFARIWDRITNIN